MPHTPNKELRDRIHAQVVKIINTYGFHESMRLNQPYKVLAVGNQELDEIVDMISSEIARAVREQRENDASLLEITASLLKEDDVDMLSPIETLKMAAAEIRSDKKLSTPKDE